MQYLQKISGSAIKAVQAAKQGLQILSDVLSPNQFKSPRDEFMFNFKACLLTLDEFSPLGNADSPAGDQLLFESKVRMYLKAMLFLLQKESVRWFQQLHDRRHVEFSETPCLDSFFDAQVVSELCRRAEKDLPRGFLPLLLATLASWLRGVKYPLLPHQGFVPFDARLYATHGCL
jgi:hypothetical protein